MDFLPPVIAGAILVSLRIGPSFAFAPPFSLIPLPRPFRALLGFSLATMMISYRPETIASIPTAPGDVAVAALRELVLGIAFATVLQIAFAAIYVAGRTVDIQAGFGLSLLIDPKSGASTPLIGTLLAMLAAALFFEMGGQYELLRILSASLDAIPLGSAATPQQLGPLLEFLGAAFVAAMGATGGLILSLFLVDMAIAMLSRTVPQMNVLILGIQVKTIVLLIALPVTLGVTAALLARIVRLALSSIPAVI